MTITPLSKQEFAAALKKGQGRALQNVIHFGLGDYKELVLDACLHNQNFDAQIDSCRAPWLFSMFRDTPFYEEFREAIFNNIETSTSWDLIQLCDFLREMAESGDSGARQRLKETVFNQASIGSDDEDIITAEFVDLQTADEFVELARIYGDRLLKDKEAFPFDELIPEKHQQEFLALLSQHAQKDHSIRKYWEYLDERGQLRDSTIIVDRDAARKNWHEKVRQKYSLDQIINDAREKKGKLPGRYFTFGKHATKGELEALYASLVREEDPEVQKRLLWAFRGTPLPELNDTLFQLAYSADEGLREAVIYALAQVKDEKIHQLAKEKIARNELLGSDTKVIGLFHQNYDKADAQLITSALYSVKANEEDIHDLGYNLIGLSEAQEDPGLSDALKWVYEHTPCMFCRYKSIIQLKTFGEIDEQILQELPFDAQESIRKFASK